MRQLTEQEGRDARQSCDKRWRHAPPRSIFMAPAVGGVAHGSFNALTLAERARTAHRQKKEPWPLTPICCNLDDLACNLGVGRPLARVTSWAKKVVAMKSVLEEIKMSFYFAQMQGN